MFYTDPRETAIRTALAYQARQFDALPTWDVIREAADETGDIAIHTGIEDKAEAVRLAEADALATGGNAYINEVEAGDLTVSGADLVDWFSDWREGARATLTPPTIPQIRNIADTVESLADIAGLYEDAEGDELKEGMAADLELFGASLARLEAFEANRGPMLGVLKMLRDKVVAPFLEDLKTGLEDGTYDEPNAAAVVAGLGLDDIIAQLETPPTGEVIPSLRGLAVEACIYAADHADPGDTIMEVRDYFLSWAARVGPSLDAIPPAPVARVFVHVAGGNVADVWTDSILPGVEVVVVDYDTDGETDYKVSDLGKVSDVAVERYDLGELAALAPPVDIFPPLEPIPTGTTPGDLVDAARNLYGAILACRDDGEAAVDALPPPIKAAISEVMRRAVAV